MMVVEVHEIKPVTLCSLLFADSRSPARAIHGRRESPARIHDLQGLARE